MNGDTRFLHEQMMANHEQVIQHIEDLRSDTREDIAYLDKRLGELERFKWTIAGMGGLAGLMVSIGIAVLKSAGKL